MTVILTKDRARKPLLEAGGASGGGAGGSQTCDRTGKTVYRLTLYPPHVQGMRPPGYEVTLDRATMLEIVQSWLAGEARDAREAAKKAAKEAT